MRLADRCIPVLFLAFAAMVGFAGAASEARACAANEATEFGISPGCFDLHVSGPPTAVNAAPDLTQAGDYPHEIAMTFHLNAPTAADPEAVPSFPNWPPEPLKDLVFSLPPGYAAGSSAASCTMEELARVFGAFAPPECPASSQVGVASADLLFFGEIAHISGVPIYNLVSPPGNAARFGFTVLLTTVVLDAKPRPSSDYGLTIGLRNLNQALVLDGINVSLWGIPADPRHTPERACPGSEFPPSLGGPTCAAGVPPRPLLRLPTSCGATPVAAVEADSWEHPGVFSRASVENHLAPGLLGDPHEPSSYPVERPGLEASEWGPPQGFTECGELPFRPSIGVLASSRAVGAPTGLDLATTFPQDGLADGQSLGEADLRAATIALPRGMSINPSMANGLEACSAGEAGLDSESPARCPDASKLGSVEMRSPMLSRALTGSVYLAEPERGPASSLPIYVIAEDDALAVKLEAEVRLDGEDDRLQAVFTESPQVPLSLLRLRFFGGDGAPFVNPTACGAATVHGRFTPWSGSAAVNADAAYQVDSIPTGGPCSAAAGRPFAPTIKGGVNDPRAGRPSAFSLTIGRADGQQELEAFAATLPPGLTASLGGVSRCSEGAIAAASADDRAGAEELASPSCPAASRIGGFEAVVGAGSRPLPLETGRLYLGGKYQGASFSIVAIAPVLAGPLDLGTLVMQMPLEFGPRDGRVRIGATLPDLRHGMRLGLRRLSLKLDRPGFIFNPTRCRGTTIAGRFEGDEGARASASAPFFLRRCRALGFKPSLRMRATGGESSTRHGANPGLQATVKMRGGGVNLRRAAFVMPAAQQLDPSHLEDICTMHQSASNRGCPPDTVYGHARLRTPILDKPLRGPIYMRASKHRFPDLVAALSGPIDLELSGRMAFGRGRVRIVFDEVPDVPVSQFSLRIDGGRRGILVNNRNLCAARPFARAALTAQNGISKALGMPLAVDCG
jgi:hypothetical protein